MAYQKTIWNDDSTPALNANNLNKIEQGIYDSHEKKQDKLTAGENISIDENNVISASGGGGSDVIIDISNDYKENISVDATILSCIAHRIGHIIEMMMLLSCSETVSSLTIELNKFKSVGGVGNTVALSSGKIQQYMTIVEDKILIYSSEETRLFQVNLTYFSEDI